MSIDDLLCRIGLDKFRNHVSKNRFAIILTVGIARHQLEFHPGRGVAELEHGTEHDPVLFQTAKDIVIGGQEKESGLLQGIFNGVIDEVEGGCFVHPDCTGVEPPFTQYVEVGGGLTGIEYVSVQVVWSNAVFAEIVRVEIEHQTDVTAGRGTAHVIAGEATEFICMLLQISKAGGRVFQIIGEFGSGVHPIVGSGASNTTGS